MTLRLQSRCNRPLLLVAMAVLCAGARGQQLIGYVATSDADVTGSTDTVGGRAVLMGSVSVTAKDHAAPIVLGRGGSVNVCQTSQLHVTESRSTDLAAPLLFSLDRGAIEIQMNTTASDAVMTPDLRFTVRLAGPLDLHLRVARNGDTCVENRGAGGPTLAVSDPFGDTMYELRPGQHVLFEHGSLHEVVDHESTPCGCPDAKGMSVADALLAGNHGAIAWTKATPAAVPAVVAPGNAAMQHPFPAAISEGLAPAAEVPQAATGVETTQVTESLSYNAGGGATKDPDANAASAAAAAAMVGPAAVAVPTPVAAALPAAAKAPQRGFGHAVGRFFRRLFGP